MVVYTLHFENAPDNISTGGAGHVTRTRVRMGVDGAALTDLGDFVSDPESGNDGVWEWTPQSVDVSLVFDPSQNMRVEFECNGDTTSYLDTSHIRRVRVLGDDGSEYLSEYPQGCPLRNLMTAEYGGDGRIATDGGLWNVKAGASWDRCKGALETSGTTWASLFFSFDKVCPCSRPTVGYVGSG